MLLPSPDRAFWCRPVCCLVLGINKNIKHYEIYISLTIWIYLDCFIRFTFFHNALFCGFRFPILFRFFCFTSCRCGISFCFGPFRPDPANFIVKLLLFLNIPKLINISLILKVFGAALLGQQLLPVLANFLHDVECSEVRVSLHDGWARLLDKYHISAQALLRLLKP